MEEFGEEQGVCGTEPHKIRWVQKQIDGYYNAKTRLMDRNTCDPVLLSARIYEACWLPDWELQRTAQQEVREAQ